MKFFVISIVLILSTISPGCYSFDIMSAMGQALGLVKIENPNYQVVDKIDSITEIRKYQISKWVSTNMNTNVKKMDSVSSQMFKKLFKYISKYYF